MSVASDSKIPSPPIDPRLVYPWRWLHVWGFGSRGIASLVKAGLPVLRFGRLKFFYGEDLIATIKKAQSGQHPAGLESEST